MKLLFTECNMGIAGDMFLSALLDLFEEKETVISELNSLGIPDVTYKMEQKETCGIYGTHVRVLVGGCEEHSMDGHHHHDDEEHHGHHHHHDEEHHGHHHHHYDEEHHGHHHHHHGEENHHHHAGMEEITQIIEGLAVSTKVKEDAKTVYQKIADAESRVHQKSVTEIHFHEVGSKDAIADIVGCAYLMEKLGVDQIVFSPIVTGFGKVRCAHGILPVPAPATALLLENVPSLAGQEEGELATPTGVALAIHYAERFEQRPMMNIRKIGYGMGSKEFKTANCVRVFLGDTL